MLDILKKIVIIFIYINLFKENSMKNYAKNPTQPNPTLLIYLILFVSFLSLFSLSCANSKINGLEKYNGNVYVSLEPEITGGEGEFTYYYYRWIYIEDGLVHSIQAEGNTQKPHFEKLVYDYFGNKMGPAGIYYKGSGNSYSYENKSYNLNTDNDENIPEYHTYKITLEFSEDGKSIAYNSVENGFYLHDYGTYTVNLTLTLFKETETSEDKDTIETPTPPEIISPELIPEDIE